MRQILILIAIFTTFATLTSSARGAELLTNGGFETGSFTGWTFVNAATNFRPWTVSGSGFGGDDGNGFFPVPTSTMVQQGSFSAWNGVTAGAGQSFTLHQQVTVPAGQTLSVQWIDRYQMNHTQFCSTSCGTAQYFVEITNTSGTVLQTLYSVTTPTNTNTNTGFVTHYALLGTTYAGQTIRLRFRTLVQNSLQGPGQLEIDNVRLQAPAVLNPTSATASLGGRVLTSEGMPIAKSTVTLTDSTGNTQTTLTNPFGYYNFTDMPTGQTYVVAVANKRFLFPGSPRVISLQDDLTGLDFTAAP